MSPSNNKPDDSFDLLFEAELSLNRLLPRIRQRCQWDQCEFGKQFEGRLMRYWPRLFGLLHRLYGRRYDFFYHLEKILETIVESWQSRNSSLNELDNHRINHPNWFQSHEMVGGALYVDLFSENLAKLHDCISYFQDLGINYVHLMPLFAVRPGDNDGGYAISNYRSVKPELGTIEDLKSLADHFHEAGICLVLDFVLNHTSDDHEWAQRAQSGEREFQHYYYIFDDREIPDQYERTLREIFPTVRRGNFTRHEGLGKYVWTTFNSFQWDLNYGNPAVFNAMVGEMLFIANTGVDVLRLDAVAFIWKQLGTSCENLPEAHLLVESFNTVAKISAPGLLFKSEAIVHPDEVVKYISSHRCQLSYNPTLMALLWESLATRETKLLQQTLSHRHQLPDGTTWTNYLRCHDDIGWTFDDGDASAVGIKGFDHRQFLNEFYTGQFPGSFARGIPFQHNLETGDMRISGTMASLAGLEKAIEDESDEGIEAAMNRIRLIYGVIFSIGGIPLIYMGEEWGMLNDYDFVKDPAKAGDTRWIHRPKMKWEYLEAAPENGRNRKIFEATKHLIGIRKSLPALEGQQMELLKCENPHLLSYARSRDGNRVIVLANFSENRQIVPGNFLRKAGVGRFFKDHITGESIVTSENVEIEGLQVMWLERQ